MSADINAIPTQSFQSFSKPTISLPQNIFLDGNDFLSFDFFQYFPELSDLIPENLEKTPAKQAEATITCYQSDQLSLSSEQTEITLEKPITPNSQNAISDFEHACQVLAKDDNESDISEEKYNDQEKLKSLNWVPEDDDLLNKITEIYKNDWKKVARRFKRLTQKPITPAFARRRYKQISDSTQVKCVRFTHQEDLLIIKLMLEHSMNWVKIAGSFSNRSPLMIKNRYYSHIKKKGLFDKLKEELEGKGETKVEGILKE